MVADQRAGREMVAVERFGMGARGARPDCRIICSGYVFCKHPNDANDTSNTNNTGYTNNTININNTVDANNTGYTNKLPAVLRE